MSDISVSERRLSAALDRIDQLLEAGAGRRAEANGQATEALQVRLDGLAAENARLVVEIEALRDRPAAAPADTADAARLVAANEDLAAANRALIDAAAGSGDLDRAMREALEAEIEALRAARAAEIGQLSDIMIELERVLADQGETTPARPEGVPVAVHDAVLPEIAGDGAGVPEDEPAAGATDPNGDAQDGER